MRRSASEIIRNLETRISQLEGRTASNTPITLSYPSNPGHTRSKTLTRTVNGLGGLLKEVQSMYNKGTSIEDPKDEFEEIDVPWDTTDWTDLGETIMFSVDHQINYDGNPSLEVSKSEICKAMCDKGLLDKVIDNFLKKNLRTR